GEELIAPRRLTRGETLANQGVALGDQLAVPGAAVLVLERDQLTARGHPRGPAGLGQEHQREQSGNLAIGRQKDPDQPGQPDRLGGQVAAHRFLRGVRREVALVEDEKEDDEDPGDPGWDVLAERHTVGDPGGLDLRLRPRDPPAHRGLLDEEGAGDLGHGEPADHPQGQRDPRLHREGGVAAREHEAEPVVVDRAERLGGVGQHQRLPVFLVAPDLAPEVVDGLAIRGGGEPRAGIGRYAVGRPAFDGDRERFGGHLLGDVEVPEAAGQCRDHPGPLFAVDPGDHLADVGHSPRTGRTSTLRLQAFDPAAASRSATSRWGASMIQNPAMCSFDSRYGPSVNTGSPPLASTTVAVLGDARPPANTQWPSVWSRSLKTSIADCSSSVARSFESKSTESRYCAIGIISCGRVAAPSGRLSTLLRTPPFRSDTLC